MSLIFLHKLASNNKVTEIKQIIAPFKNDTKSLYSIINRYNKFGMTALHGAIFYGRLEAVRLLLDLGANPNIQTRSHLCHYYFTFPLHLAALSGKLRITKALLAAGANPKLKDWSGILASQIARQSGHVLVADLLSKEEEKMISSSLMTLPSSSNTPSFITNMTRKYQTRHVKLSLTISEKRINNKEIFRESQQQREEETRGIKLKERAEMIMNRITKWNPNKMEFIIQDHYSDDDCCYKRKKRQESIKNDHLDDFDDAIVKFNSLPSMLRMERREIKLMDGHVPAGPWDLEENIKNKL